ncbi:hypothetical protein [Streptomyces sp. ALB3]|uniref:hypothetical protein n=1 Tax=Streptomyces sp. ALB3 TaxID=3374278 RepID=UPI00379796ED
MKVLEDIRTDPFVAPCAHRGRRARLVGVLLVDAAGNEAGQELGEDDSVGDAGPVTTQRMGDGVFSKQRLELLPHEGR